MDEVKQYCGLKWAEETLLVSQLPWIMNWDHI